MFTRINEKIEFNNGVYKIYSTGPASYSMSYIMRCYTTSCHECKLRVDHLMCISRIFDNLELFEYDSKT